MIEQREQEILSHLFKSVSDYIDRADSSQKVLDYKTPDELSRTINLSIGDQGVEADTFHHLMNKYLAFSVQTGNKQFMNQLYGGFNFPAFVGDVLTSLANTSMYTYEVAPVATMIEREMIRLMNAYTGYDKGDGIFLTGGSNANLLAMFSARNRKFPESRFLGIQPGRPLKAFVNEHAHYSFEHAANILGIGAQNVIKVQATDAGSMDPVALETAIKSSIQQGEIPFFIGATCGTTVLGAFDPLMDLAGIAQKYKLWLHADGAFGGSLIVSQHLRKYFKGIEKTDSFGWNPHKLMNIPLVCSVLLVKQKGALHNNLTDINSEYIFHDTNDVEDLGRKSVQCGRRVDAVKLWFSWKYFGKEGYERRVEHLVDMAAYAEEKVRNHPKLELLAPRQSLTVCFRYNSKDISDLNEFNFQLREKMRREGTSIVNYAYLNETLTIRLIMANAETEQKDVDRFFANMISAAKHLETQ